jgi:hypothetical protein
MSKLCAKFCRHDSGNYCISIHTIIESKSVQTKTAAVLRISEI